MLIAKYKTKDITKKLEDFEAKLGYELPHQYRQFLLKYNGGETTFTKIEVNFFENSIEYFYGFVKVSEYHSIDNKYVKDIQKEFLTPQKVFGIAELGGGDVLCIGIDTDNHGEMYYSNHDEGYKVTKIANSFKDLLSVIKSEPIDKSTLEHPDEIIERQIGKIGRRPNDKVVERYWKQYNDLLNLEQEEVTLD